jgi:hypothetical protein
MLLLSVAVPLWVASSRASPYAGAAHDEAVVRALGLGWTGAFRALDVPVSSLFLFLPFGTRALRAALVGASLGGASAGLLFLLARRVIMGAAGSSAAWVALVASACASLSGAWLVESSAPGSSLLGVVLALGPVVLLVSRADQRAWPLVTCLLAAALTYEPLVGLVACSACLPGLALGPRREWRKSLVPCLLGFAAGCVPFLVALACRGIAGARLDSGLFGAWAGEGAASTSANLWPLLVGELGHALPGLALVGAVQVLLDRRLRAIGSCALAMALASALAVSLGAPAGKEHWSAPALTLLGAASILAAVPMHALVTAVSRAKLPLASLSAAMVVLLELTFPVLTLDEGLERLDRRDTKSTRLWDDATFEPLASGSLVLVEDRRLYARALAARATGELRADLTLVPTFDVASPAAERELAYDPSLYPLWRDLVLHGSPRERTLSSVAASRPLALEFQPTWDRGILRHVVPSGLLASFHPEPRGASERLLAIDAAEPLGDVFTAAQPREGLETPQGNPGDEVLATLTAKLLDARAKSLLSLGEREAAGRVEGDVSSLALPSVAGDRHARRLLTARGSRVAISP